MKKRFLSATVFLPAIIALTFAGNYFFLFLIALTSFVAAYECNKILKRRNTADLPLLSGAFSAILVILTYFFVSKSSYTNVITVTVLISSIVSMTWMLFYLESTPKLIRDMAGLLAPAIYTGGILSLTISVREASQGLVIIFYLITLTSAADTGAYVIGKFVGKTPFFPRISPSKTWEGSVGAMLCAIGASVLFAIATSKTNIVNISITHSILIGISVGFAGQIGDLYESSLKRKSRMKDSGTLIPGHGGVLDRIDSVIFNIPVIYYSMQWLIE